MVTGPPAQSLLLQNAPRLSGHEGHRWLSLCRPQTSTLVRTAERASEPGVLHPRCSSSSAAFRLPLRLNRKGSDLQNRHCLVAQWDLILSTLSCETPGWRCLLVLVGTSENPTRGREGRAGAAGLFA